MAGVDASRHSLPVTASNDESDWEYEYDETESEVMSGLQFIKTCSMDTKLYRTSSSLSI